MEYALLLALLAVLMIGGLTALGHSVSGLLGRVSGAMTEVLNS